LEVRGPLSRLVTPSPNRITPHGGPVLGYVILVLLARDKKSLELIVTSTFCLSTGPFLASPPTHGFPNSGLFAFELEGPPL
jgi:hypothetical protein